MRSRTPSRDALARWVDDQSGPHVAFAVSIDRLTVINEVLGHAVGDEVLEHLHQRVRSWSGETACIERVEGARFLVVRTDLPDRRSAVDAAQELLAAAALPMSIAGRTLARSASVGIAIDLRGAAPGWALIRDAVRAEDVVRDEGGGRVEVHDPARSGARDLARVLEVELLDALAARQLSVHYQPEFDAVSSTLLGVEALVRWNHPTHGLLPAEAFVPEVENTPGFAEAQRFVIERACSQLGAWAAEHGPARASMRVNVSARHLLSGPVLGDLLTAPARHRLDARALCVEVTERTIPADLEPLVSALASLRAGGLRVSVDDFGTGASALGHLAVLPADGLKLDRTFVQDVADPKVGAILAAMVDLARELGLETVAEGVDGPEVLDEMRRLGCDRVQGNWLSPALTADGVAALLTDHAAGGRRGDSPPSG